MTTELLEKIDTDKAGRQAGQRQGPAALYNSRVGKGEGRVVSSVTSLGCNNDKVEVTDVHCPLPTLYFALKNITSLTPYTLIILLIRQKLLV